jgi:GMP synthase-like glutamine amidotransferase
MNNKTFLIVQHMDWEGPGQHLLAALNESGVAYRVLQAWHEPMPAVTEFAGLIVLGGSPNVDEEERFPYLAPLKAAIRQVISAGGAYLGFCLGHQLLGHVLGCRVGPLPRKSVGFITGELTPEGLAHPAFQGFPARPDLFKWHGQGVLPPLPAGIEILARSAAAPVEALGPAGNPKVLGLQFDNHAGPADVEKWLKFDGDWALSDAVANAGDVMAKTLVWVPLYGVLVKNTGDDLAAAIVAAAKTREAEMARDFRRFMDNFLHLALA